MLAAANSTSRATFAYDTAGNITGDGANVYTYDKQNRLNSSEEKLPGGSAREDVLKEYGQFTSQISVRC
jgi:hypothetical protein